MKELSVNQMHQINGGSLTSCIGAATFGLLTIFAATNPATVALGWGTATVALGYLADCG